MIVFFKRYRMQFDLRGVAFESPTLPRGISLLPWSRSLLRDHAEAKFRSFEHEMDANVFSCLGRYDGCLRLMREICDRSSFTPEATWLMVHDDPESGQRRRVGTVQGVLSQGRTGMIQNIGIVPAYRGQGLGSIIVRQSLAGFQSVGAPIVTLEVTTQNRGAIRLYERLGFVIQKTVYKSVEVPTPH